MNIKMTKKVLIYQKLNRKKKPNKSRDRIMDTENIFMVARWERRIGEWVKR